ncbi:SPW repeat domain-containing protein [Roseiconus lacunae]
MWGRVVEIMTAVWIAASPFVFGVQDDPVLLWADQSIALTICLLAGLSYWRPTRHAHLLILAVAIGLTIWGRFAELPPSPPHQNHIVVGLFLLMIALIPNQASQPPNAWRRHAGDGLS